MLRAGWLRSILPAPSLRSRNTGPTRQMLYVHGSQAPKWNIAFSVVASALLFVGCIVTAAYEDHVIGDYGHLEVRPSQSHNGFVVAVPDGTTEPDAVEYAKTISDSMGAGIVIAYGFDSNRNAAAQPIIDSRAVAPSNTAGTPPGSIYPDFQTLVQSSAVGPLKFYLELRTATTMLERPRIEVASAGFTFEQLYELKRSYRAIETFSLKDRGIARVELRINPLDPISWNAYGIKNHGALMLAEKGLVLRLPTVLTQSRNKSFYRYVISKWLRQTVLQAQTRALGLTETTVQQLPYGRIELTPGTGALRGIVIAAPHGSFDWYTGELVEELRYRTSLPSVVTRGFTPTECGGWRIDVNRPTERRYPTDDIERTTERAIRVYQEFKQTVMAASRGPLNLYIDMHQNGTEEDIVVATLGITRAEAAMIKAGYRQIRDEVISANSQIPKVNFLIEPLDEVSIGAWAAKDHGILRLAKKSLHFELPAHHVFYGQSARQAYTKILAELINSMITRHYFLYHSSYNSEGED